MANPNNAIGTNAAFGGRTSPNAFNDVLASFQGRGILSGWACSPDSGMTITLGGDGTTRDVAIAEDNAGNKTTVDNIPASPISLTIAAAPATQSRIDAVVVYVKNPPQGSSTETDNYGTIGILDVQGTTASTPIAPDDSDIRTAITADGASGATAYYVVLAYVTVASGTTTLTSAEIEAGPSASFRNTILNSIYPVGSIYMSTNSTNPSNIFGGTWVQIKDTFLLSAGDNYTAGNTGGEATHTLTTQEMPAHRHKVGGTGGGDGTGEGGYLARYSTSSDLPYSLRSNNSDPTYWSTSSVGSGQAHNNMPPYLVVYMWKRTA